VAVFPKRGEIGLSVSSEKQYLMQARLVKKLSIFRSSFGPGPGAFNAERQLSSADAGEGEGP
jgi:hypothetical protein